MKKILFLVISLILVTVVILAMVPSNIKNRVYLKAYCLFLNYKQLPTTKNEQKLLIKIPQQATLNQILTILKDNNILQNDQTNKFYCVLHKNRVIPKLKAGYFIIEPHISYQELAKKLQNPEISNITITIPEGLRYDQIAKLLDKNLSGDFSKFDKQEFEKLVKKPDLLKDATFMPQNLSTLEGFLFPDTYQINKFEITAKDFIQLMLSNFKKKALPLLKQHNNYENQLDLDVYAKLKIASIIERETNKNLQERQMVADIIYKRLQQNMLLQIDATLLYPKKDWTYQLTYADLHEDNPYNTYTRHGLPPTPICNPGLSAIQASVTPIANNYYYYMHDKQGKIHYATTFSQHLYNVQTYLR